jgi:myo-inositol 2-dehydrogenase/D-chiro-inositol 1-dehydrogenase/scyllo-inositol 2-dehydrogenase (NAD+)
MALKRICMIGAGRVGQLHSTSITRHLADRAKVTALVEPNQELRHRVAQEFGIERGYATLGQALDDATFDGAVITTPTFTHRDLAVAALEAGLHLHLEKPMAMNLVECAQITAAQQAAGTAVQLGFMRRFDPDFEAAAEYLASGQVGQPVIIKSLTHGPGLPPAWANDIRTSNGLIAEVTSHDLDAVGWFAGSPPVDISVRASNFKGAERGVDTPNFYDTMLATITFQSGALASVAGVCPADYGYDSRLEVTATKGVIQVGQVGPGGLAVAHAGGAEGRPGVYPSWRARFAAAYIREMAGFVDAMEGAALKVGLAEGTQAVALVIAGVTSLLEERTVALSEVTATPVVPAWQVAA